ncbi:zinc finger protein 234-like [Metopolophium dirhodum]|uniref:zinc finger protein 234-like n=1 Tax=Metopolophium dirhodum TaxID=44670 RepID=UPI00298F9C17|nr:zinc finger protein 234-like [Metopolophium dirhodum]XP_060867166.1 zinc finger protein 234-like [Metopolophium dirhodum]XP_060867167.1 zinc finger protein 234-like [Metopolophium dirhodum]
MATDLELERSSTTTSNTCLICDGSTGVSARNAISIFQHRVSSSDRTVVKVIDGVLGIILSSEDVHSIVVCRRCFKSLNEVDELEDRLADIKLELTSQYQRTLKSKSEGLDIHTIDTIDTELEVDTPKPVKKRGRRPKIKEESIDIPISNEDILHDDIDLKEIEKQQKCSSVDNLIEMLEEDGKDNNLVSMNIEEECSQKLIQPADIKQESILHAEMENIDEDDDLDGSAILDEDDSDYEGIDDSKNDDAESGSPKKQKMAKSSLKKKTPEILIPQMLVHHDGDVYTCLLCSVDNKFTADARGIVIHAKNVHQIKLFICDICGQEFLKRPELMKHLEHHANSEDGNFVCDICSRVFTNVRMFRVHKKMHMPQSKNHTCETCGRQFASRNTLEEHNNTHTGVRPYRCEICGKDFTSKYTFKAHEKVHTNRERNFTCINCGKAFLTEQNLIHHERTHSGLKNYVCQKCGKAFGTARNLEVHYVVHTGYKPFICRMCGKAFARKAEIRDHERIHTGEKPYQCEFCGATFSQRSNLQSHKRATHYDDKRYKCTDCGKGFKRRRLLDYHMKAAHTGERPFKCDVCQASFIYPEHFKKHARIHTGEKPYLCEVCGKAFNSRDNRNAHRFVHSDKKPYECLVCGAGFMRKPLLYNHMTQAGHLNDTIVVNQPRLASSPVTIQEIQEDIQMPVTDTEMELAMVVDSEGNQTELRDMTEEERKLFAGELKEHILLPGKQEDLGNDLNSVEQILVDNKYQIQYTTTDQHGDVHTMLNMDHHGDDGDVDVGHMETVTVSVGGQEHRQLIVPATRHITLNESDAAAFAEHATINGENVQIVQIQIQDDDGEDQKHWFNIIQPQQG